MGRKVVAGNTICSVAPEETVATFSTEKRGDKGFGDSVEDMFSVHPTYVIDPVIAT